MMKVIWGRFIVDNQNMLCISRVGLLPLLITGIYGPTLMVSYNEPLFGDYVTTIELIHSAGHHLLSTPTMCADSEVPLAVAPGRVLGSGIEPTGIGLVLDASVCIVLQSPARTSSSTTTPFSSVAIEILSQRREICLEALKTGVVCVGGGLQVEAQTSTRSLHGY